ncbi:hypothetical protein JOL79_22260 [Microbispora sp. RL4-1S]|uniref:LppX_LprAFG lipoprotein n=1 Tax=Microbispora oryzae TaxID=2806554 RepID=A0A940WNB2_9ACTN|nr:hypothetical protein [Microbispora oryzae]MBP2706537.1 hypothetical protein [Microbispora oryzae]
MRRTIAALICAASAVLAAPGLVAPAHARTRPAAGATDPAAALRAQYVPGRGVHVATTTVLGSRGQRNTISTHDEGDVEFGRSGVAASDFTASVTLSGAPDEIAGLLGDQTAPTRTVIVKGVAYTQGGLFSDVLPQGKTWLRSPKADPAAPLWSSLQVVQALDPAMLAATLAATNATGRGGTVDGTPTTLYRGTITLQRLYSAVPTLKPQLKYMSARERATRVYWRIWMGADRLVRKVTTATRATLKVGKTEDEMIMTGTTRYTHWGRKFRVTPPPAYLVADISEINFPTPAALPDYINLGD